MKLFLDDERFPPADDNVWFIVRNYDEAVDFVETYGFPDFISFDHDLGPDEKTGADFAHYLVNRDLDNEDMPEGFTFYVHSQNPIGKTNIESLLNNYMGVR